MKDVIERVESAVSKEVTFDYPEGTKKGILKERIWERTETKSGDVGYINTIDFIEFEGEKELWMRISYYRVFPNGKLVWGGQYSIAEPLSEWKGLIKKTAKDNQWFRHMLIDVVTEILGDQKVL